jgi:hypothetical protein
MSGSYHVNLEILWFCMWFMRRKYVNNPTLFLHSCDYPLWRGLGYSFFLKQEWFVPSLIEIGQMFHFRMFFPIYLCKNCFPSCGPSQSLGTIIWTILNLHDVRKLSCKYELFWLSGSREEKFSMTSPHICIFVIISPWKRTWSFI